MDAQADLSLRLTQRPLLVLSCCGSCARCVEIKKIDIALEADLLITSVLQMILLLVQIKKKETDILTDRLHIASTKFKW